MHPHTRALIAASACAVITGQKVAGLYDHTAREHLRIAAECRGTRLQGHDEARAATFGGTLPDLYDNADRAFISLSVNGTRATGHDHGSNSAFVADVTDRMIQLYDYSQNAWFAFEAQRAEDGAAAND